MPPKPESDVKSRSMPKMMKVAPTLTEPSMKNSLSDGDKVSAEDMLKELGEDDDTEQLRKSAFSGKHKTKEETTAVVEEQGTNTMLIIVFALIVIALVALVVWMVLRQNEAKKLEEEDIRQRLQPNPRNNMPPLNVGAGSLTPQQAAQMQAQQVAQQQFMLQQQQQQVAQQQLMLQQQAAQQQAQARGAAAGKTSATPSSASTTPSVQATAPVAQDDLADLETEEKAPVMNTTIPPPTRTTSQDLDDLAAKTAKMMEETDGLNDMDRNMLNTFAQETYDKEQNLDE